MTLRKVVDQSRNKSMHGRNGTVSENPNLLKKNYGLAGLTSLDHLG